MSSVLSSDSNCALFSSSEPSLRGNDGLPATSVTFEVTEDDYDQLRLHEHRSVETWTHNHTVDAHFSATLSGLIPCAEDLPWCTSPPPMTTCQTRANDGTPTHIPNDDSDEIATPQSEWSPHWPQSEWSPHWIMRDSPETSMIQCDSPETSMIQCERKPLSTEPWIPSECLDWIPSELDDHSDHTSHTIYHQFRENPIDYGAASTSLSPRNVSSRQTLDSQFVTLFSNLGPAVFPSHDALTIPTHGSPNSNSFTHWDLRNEDSSISSSFSMHHRSMKQVPWQKPHS